MTVGENHSIKASGLDFIWDAIRDAEMMADSKGKLETLKSFLPRKDNKWRLVFCVPRRVEDKWSRCQKFIRLWKA